jgi:hypothetical protein
MRTSALGAWVLAAAGAFVAPACGSNGGDRCGEVQPCGGEVVGSWSWSRACPSAKAYTTQAQATCPESSVASVSQSVTGTVTFNADLTFRFENVSNTLETNNSFPLSCQALTTCTDLDRHETSNAQTIDTTCTGTTTCTCDSTVSTSGRTATGTYSTAGAALTLILDGVTATTGYCVEGNRLHQITFASGAGQTVILTDSVAERLTR